MEESIESVNEMSVPAVESKSPVQQTRSSSRERSLTEKGMQMRKHEAKKQEKAFNKAYGSWKQTAKESRSRLKTFCSREELDKIQQEIQSRHHSVHQCYEPILRNYTTTPEIVDCMDACAALTEEISDLVSKRLETVDEDYNEVLMKERVRQADLPTCTHFAYQVRILTSKYAGTICHSILRKNPVTPLCTPSTQIQQKSSTNLSAGFISLNSKRG